jgi:iron(III) transport system substrate-binding protein
MNGRIVNRKFAICNLHFSICILSGCWSGGSEEIIVYSALDREFAEPVLDEYARKTGVTVRGVYDVESSKTVGLVERIIAESDRPACDLFWNNEILHTLRLEKLGLLVAYRSPSAEAYPAMYRSPEGRWHGFAARARVLLVNTKRVADAERPKSIEDLSNSKWRGQAGIARPLFGTTATHAACLFAALGDEKARDYFQRLKANQVQVLSGNKQVAQRVSAGQLAFGLTDTDDAIIELEAGHPVAIVYPDQGEGQLGALFIPNTLALIKGSPNHERAKALVDYLLSPEVESKLAAGPSAQIPLNPSVKSKLRVETPATVRPMQVDFSKAAEKWNSASKFLHNEFLAN